MTTNNRLIKSDRSLVKNMSQVSLGTILKGFRGSRGIDYIVTGIDANAKEIYVIKHNSINQDGSINKNVNKHSRVFKYSLTPSGQFGIIKGITSILGQKDQLDVVALNTFNQSVNSNISITRFKDIGLYSKPITDRRNTGVWE